MGTGTSVEPEPINNTLCQYVPKTVKIVILDTRKFWTLVIKLERQEKIKHDEREILCKNNNGNTKFWLDIDIMGRITFE
jgi:hypothetical protein